MGLFCHRDSPELFYTLYDQGFHADILLRTIVASVVKSDGEVLVNNPRDPSYSEFLQFCDELNEAQVHHFLIVNKSKVSEQTHFRESGMKDVVDAIAAGLSVSNNVDPIGDVGGAPLPDMPKPESENRRVFSLLTVLFADVSIDPQKLPVQQLIQVH